MSASQAPVFQKRYIVFIVLLLIALYAIVPQISAVRGSLPLVRDADRGLSLLAIGAALFSYVAAAGVYMNLSLKPLRFGRTLFMQFAAMFANRLLPAGLGGIGINYLYLKKQKQAAVQAASVVTANNTLGFIGHGLLIASVVTFGNAAIPVRQNSHAGIIIVALVGLLALALALLPRMRKKIAGFLHGVGAQLLQYRKRPGSLATALACSIILSVSNVLAFQLSSLAVGVELGFAATLLIFTFGLSVGTATPTPGSLGGIEAGLVAGMLAYNVEPAPALGAVLLYRLVSYWLPLILGSALFMVARRRRYF